MSVTMGEGGDDFFRLLGVEQRPWLDPESLKETFQQLSREQHPDASGSQGSQEFARLNQAYATLRDPKSRLRYLLERQAPDVRGTAPATVPASVAELFAPVSSLLREIDDLLARKAAAATALGKALLARQEWGARAAAEDLLEKLRTLREQSEEDLRAFDAAWNVPPAADLPRLREFQQRFAYLDRWLEQLRERLYQLGL